MHRTTDAASLIRVYLGGMARVVLVVLLAVVSGAGWGARDGWAHPVTPRLYAFVLAGNGAVADRPREGPALDVAMGWVDDVAPVPGGGFLALVRRHEYDFDDASRWLLRVGADGRVRHVAGAVRQRGCVRREWAPARQACLGRVTAIAALPGGAVLVATRTRVRRVELDGRIHTVAGSRYSGYSGDGGPAADADLGRVTDLLVMPDGGYAIADLRRVRAVSPDGTITTIAGDGSAPPQTTVPIEQQTIPAVPALDARLDGYVTLTLLPDGSVAIGEEAAPVVGAINRDGVLAPLTRSNLTVTDVAATADGIVYAKSYEALYRVRPGGMTRIGDSPYDAQPLRDGMPVTGRGIDPAAIAPAGGRALLVAEARRVLLLTPIPSSVLAVALRADRGASERGRYRAHVLVTRAARVTVQVLRGGRLVEGATEYAAAGPATVNLYHRFRPGLYTVRVRAHVGGHRMTRARRLVLGGVLPVALARTIARHVGRQEVRSARTGRCRRSGARRVDCVVERRQAHPTARCLAVVSVRLLSTGGVSTGLYDCGDGFAARPDWAMEPHSYPLERLGR